MNTYMYRLSAGMRIGIVNAGYRDLPFEGPERQLEIVGDYDLATASAIALAEIQRRFPEANITALDHPVRVL